jgi:hypothetical protein
MIIQAKEIIENAYQKTSNVVSWRPGDSTTPTMTHCNNRKAPCKY